jgi:hypothetical protein
MRNFVTVENFRAGLARVRVARDVRFARCRSGFAVGIFFLLCAQMAASAEPLNLFDPRPREVRVSFENSPREFPARLNSSYSQDYRAYLSPGLSESEVRVVIPAHTVEAHLLGEQKVVRESFSDFVWTFDVATGHVISAHLTGRVRPKIDWGFITTEIQTDIEVDMGTARVGGFRRPLRVMGQLVFRYCSNLKDKSCQFVKSVALDRSTGYVNAIGQVRVRSMFVELWNFSPMGEAIFSELEPIDEVFVETGAGTEFSLPVGLQGLPVVSDSTLFENGRALKPN